jgi:hypothetical protein
MLCRGDVREYGLEMRLQAVQGIAPRIPAAQRDGRRPEARSLLIKSDLSSPSQNHSILSRFKAGRSYR